MKTSDRKKYKFLLIIAAITPLSLIAIISPQLSISQVVAGEVSNENSIIYVDSQIGNDSDRGTIDSPLKTITQALKIAQNNAVISLAPGNYNEATGEIFPLIIKDKITLKGIAGGQGNSVIIEGNGAFISHSAAEQNVTIAAIKNAGVITGVTVTNPHGRGHGLWIESANPQVSYSTFSRSGNTGLSVNGNSEPIITNNYFSRNGGNGLLVYDNARPKITDNLFENTGFAVSLVKNSVSVLENNTFQGNRIAVILEGNAQGVLRNNTITNSLESGLVAIANSRVDLCVSTQSGNNVFRNNKKLDIQNVTSNTISATGTEVSGQTEGNVDFSNNGISTVSLDRNTASNSNFNTANVSRIMDNPLPNNSQETTPIQSPLTNSNYPESDRETLPPPPSITNSDSQSTAKEYIFSAPVSNEENNPPTSSLENQTNSDNINSLSDILPTSAPSEIKYRVLVETNNNSQQTKVKSLYPEAFTIVYQGRSMLQVGAFSDRSKAEITSRSLADMGLNAHILE